MNGLQRMINRWLGQSGGLPPEVVRDLQQIEERARANLEQDQRDVRLLLMRQRIEQMRREQDR